MGGAIALLCLKRHPDLFAAAVLSSPMVGLRIGRLPPTLLRAITRPARAAGLGACFIPGAHKWRPDRIPSPERSRVSTDAERCRLRHAWFSTEPTLRLDEATYGWLDSALGLIARISKPEFLAAIETPILLGRPGREVVVSRKAQRRAARLLPNCTLVELTDFEARPVPRTRRDPRLLAVLPQPLRRRARRQDDALRLAAALALGLLTAASAYAADRRTIVDPNAPPWNAVAKVQTNIGTRCTGVLIAPTIVLTAAHCLYNPRTRALLQPLSLHVLFGYERAGYRWHRLVARYVVGPGFDGSKPPPQSADWARLDLAVGVPISPLQLFDSTVAAGLPAALAGYNQDRAQLLMVDLVCHLLRAAYIQGGAKFLIHDCDGTRGTSGAPLLTKQNGRWAVLGINIAAGRDANLALAPPLGR